MIDPDARFAFSLIGHARDNKPLVREFSWKAIQNLLTRYEEREEKNGPAFIPTHFEIPEDSTAKQPIRCIAHSKKVSLAVVDFDGGKTISEAMKIYADYEYIIYSSHSHGPSLDKFRLVIPLKKPVPGDKWIMAWRHLESMAPGLDTQCKDASRLYFLPSCRPGALRFTHLNEGKLLRLDTSDRPPAPSELVGQPKKATSVPMSQPATVKTIHPDGTVTEHVRAGVGNWSPEWDQGILKQLIPTYGSPLKIVGLHMRYPCPINDHPKKPDCSEFPFSITDAGVWHCFRCSPIGQADDTGDGGASGNAYGLAKMLLGLDGAKDLLREVQKEQDYERKGPEENFKLTWGKRRV
jgi:hypothetical protein